MNEYSETMKRRMRQRERLQNKLMLKNGIGGMILLAAILWFVSAFVGSKAHAQDEVYKKWFKGEAQFQISPQCVWPIDKYAREAAAFLSEHSIELTEGTDEILVRCDEEYPFTQFRRLPPGSAIEYSHISQLGVTQTSYYPHTGEIIAAHIWIDPEEWWRLQQTKGVVFHEFVHMLGGDHVEGGLMGEFLNRDFLFYDSGTIARVRERYNKPPVATVDIDGTLIIPNIFVDEIVAGTIDRDAGMYWAEVKDGVVVEFGKNSDSEESPPNE